MTRHKPAAESKLPPSSDAAEGADEAKPFAWTIPGDDQADCNGFIPAKTSREGEFTKPLYAAPQKPAPDAMREAFTQYARDLRRNPSGADDYPYTTMHEVANRIDEILSAPVPPPDGAGGWSPSNANLAMALRDLEDKVAPCWFLIVEEAAHRLSPSAAGAAEPDDVRSALAAEIEAYPVDNPTLCDLFVRIVAALRSAPVSAAPPVRDREAIARALYDLNPSMSGTQFSGPEPTKWHYDSHQKRLAYRQTDAILSLPVQSGAGEREAAIEECAKVADAWVADITKAGDQFDKGGDIYAHANVVQGVAAAIRSLAQGAKP